MKTCFLFLVYAISPFDYLNFKDEARSEYEIKSKA